MSYFGAKLCDTCGDFCCDCDDSSSLTSSSSSSYALNIISSDSNTTCDASESSEITPCMSFNGKIPTYSTDERYADTYCSNGVYRPHDMMFASTSGQGIFSMDLIMKSITANIGVCDMIKYLMSKYPECYVLGASYATLSAHGSPLLSCAVGQDYKRKGLMKDERVSGYDHPQNTYDATGFLGGACHKYEHPINAMIREMNEETGLQLTDSAYAMLMEDPECGIIEETAECKEEHGSSTMIYTYIINIEHLEYSNRRPKYLKIKYKRCSKRHKVAFAIYGTRDQVAETLESLASNYASPMWKPTDDITAIVGMSVDVALEFCVFAENHSYLRYDAYHGGWCLECLTRCKVAGFLNRF